MRICIPTETDEGFEAGVHAHFGSAPIFTVFETHTRTLEFVRNPNHRHLHGTCQPLSALSGTPVDVVVCSGMGARALQKLNGSGIKALRARGTTVEEVLRNHAAGVPEEITLQNACMQHQCH
ncbi:MAG: NifB/NifX family molybdenum-iron cluster-binding protein [Desulfobacterales bacterium]|nr:MAG: NifB/NifX family molybdenum-iron cluster-binding protein [Desulfobacterales bacterium]